MERLSSADVRSLLEAVRDLYCVRELSDFAPQAIAAVRGLIPGASHMYTEVSSRGSTGLLEPVAMPCDQVAHAFDQHVEEHPLVLHYQRHGDGRARTISDFLSERQLRALGLYAELLRPLGLGDQLAISLTIPVSATVGIGVNRERPTFTGRDRAILDLLRPHLAQARRNAEMLTRLREALEDGHQGVVVVEGQGTIRFATDPGRRLLERYAWPAATKTPPDTLPEPVLSWLCRHLDSLRSDDAPAPLRPLVLERPGRTLVVRLRTGQGDGAHCAILLDERAAISDADLRPLGLTPRERDVVQLLARGYAASDIADRLVVSVRTVEKHLEHVYAKLGVRSASAARMRIATLLRSTA